MRQQRTTVTLIASFYVYATFALLAFACSYMGMATVSCLIAAPVIGFSRLVAAAYFVHLLQFIVHGGSVLWSVASERPTTRRLLLINAAAYGISTAILTSATFWIPNSRHVSFITLLLMTTIPCLVAASAVFVRKKWMPSTTRPGICPNCGYWLAAHNPVRCPECGTPAPQHPGTP